MVIDDQDRNKREQVPQDVVKMSKTIADAFAAAGTESEVVMSAAAWQEDQRARQSIDHQRHLAGGDRIVETVVKIKSL